MHSLPLGSEVCYVEGDGRILCFTLLHDADFKFINDIAYFGKVCKHQKA